MPTSYPAQITRKEWDALPSDYRTGSPADDTARMLRLTSDMGTILIPVKVLDQPELFPLGQRVATPAALDAAVETGNSNLLAQMIDRHHRGMWGDLTSEDQDANDAALHTGDRLLSAYKDGSTKWWVITEADRSVTTVLLPTDY